MIFKLLAMLIAASLVCVKDTETIMSKRDKISFELVDPSAPYDPQAYDVLSINPELDCPGNGRICVITVPINDIYNFGPNNGKPKVDIQTGTINELQDDLAFAISNGNDPTYRNDRIIYEHQGQ